MRPVLLLALAACTAAATSSLDVEDAPAGPPPAATPDGGPWLVSQPASVDAGPLRLERSCDGACAYELAGTLPDDPGLAEQCSWFFDHLEACALGVSPSRADCPRIARTGGEPLVRYFDCVLRSDCTPNPPACRIVPSGLGGELAALRARRCPERTALPDDRRALLDDLGAQRKAVVVDLARACVTEEPCATADACLEAWIAL